MKQAKPQKIKIMLIAGILYFILALVALFYIKLPHVSFCISGCDGAKNGDIAWISLYDRVAERGLAETFSTIVDAPLLLVFIFFMTLLAQPFLTIAFLLIVLFLLISPIVFLLIVNAKYKKEKKDGLRNRNPQA